MARLVSFTSKPEDPSMRQFDEETRSALLSFVTSAPAETCLTLLTLAEHPAILRAVDAILDEASVGLR